MSEQPDDAMRAEAARTWPLERRANKRLPARGSIVIEVRKGTMGLGLNLALHLLDLSTDGAGVLMKGELQENDEVEILLSGNGIRTTLKRLARVRWVTKLESGHFIMGMSFEKQLPFSDVTNFIRPG